MAGEQDLGDARRGEEPDVPGAAVGDVREQFEPEAGQGRLDRGEAEDVGGVRGGEAEPGACAEVLAQDVDRAWR